MCDRPVIGINEFVRYPNSLLPRGVILSFLNVVGSESVVMLGFVEEL